MQPVVVPSMLLVLCMHYAAAVSVRGFLNTKALHPALRKRNNEMPGSNPELPQQEMCFTIPQLQALKEQFASYIDKNRDERASRQEIIEYLQKYNPDATEEQVDKFIARRDKDGDGYVDFIPDYLGEVSSPTYDLDTAKEWFELEDTNGDGFVSRDELVAIAVNVGMPLEEAEKTANGYYMSADTNNDGKLTWNEYRRLFMV